MKMKKRITWISSDSPAEEQEEFYKRMQKSQSQANKKNKNQKNILKNFKYNLVDMCRWRLRCLNNQFASTTFFSAISTHNTQTS